MFRAESARYAGDADFERLITSLQRISPDFRLLWSRQDVLRALGSHKRINHPKVGRMTFEYTTFSVIAWLYRPFGVSLSLADRHPWDSLRSHLVERVFKEFYFGGVYLSAGESRPHPGARAVTARTPDPVGASPLSEATTLGDCLGMSYREVYETRRSARARTPPLVPVACWTRREQSISSSDRVSRADTP